MADTALPKLPSFPTAFGETEEKRLQEVEKQKTQMEEVYKTKFTPEAWAAMSPAEKGLRQGLAGTVFAPATALAPWEWGFDYGLTPDEAQERLVTNEAEYQELLRMQRVVSLLPSIQNGLRALAVTPGKMITTREDLNKYFKLDQLGFTDDEQEYVVAFAQGLIHQSPEDIIAGQIWGLNPITPEEIAQLADDEARKIISPSQVLSTVAFSESMSDIQDALTMAYPPSGGKLSPEDEQASYEQWLKDYLANLGVSIPETFPELWKAYQEKTGIYASGMEGLMEGGKSVAGVQPVGFLMSLDETGEPLVNPDTGQPIVYTLDADNFAYYQDSLMGFYDQQRNRIVPLDREGNPVQEYQEEAAIRDILQAAHLSMKNMPYMGEQYFLNTIPMYFTQKFGGFVQDVRFDLPVEYAVEHGYTVEMPMFTPSEAVMDVLTGKKPAQPVTEAPEIPVEIAAHPSTVQKKIEQYWADNAAYYEQDYLRRQDAYLTDLADFMKEHPEYIPRPEWTEPMVDRWNSDWRSVLDPGYLAYQMANNVHTYIAAVASIGVTFATGNPWLGTATAIGLFVPMETQSLIDDLVQSGASYEQAVSWGVPGGAVISSLEGVGNIPLLKAVTPQFFKGFTAGIRQSIVRQIIAYGITTPLKIGASETLEEVLQEMAHNAIVKQVDENRGILDNITETALQAFVATAPLAWLGGGGEYLNMRRFLPDTANEQIMNDVYLFTEKGMDEDQANLMAWNNLVSTESGISQVEGAIQDMDNDIGHSSFDEYTTEEDTGMTFDEWYYTSWSAEEYSSKSESLSNKLEVIARDIAEIDQDIEHLKGRLEKDPKNATIKAMIKAKEETKASLEAEASQIESAIGELKQKGKEARKQEVTESVPEEVPLPDMVDEFDNKVWDGMFPANKVSLCKDAGIPVAIASKPASELTQYEKNTIMRYVKGRFQTREKAKPAKAVTPPTEGIEAWYEGLSDDQIQGKFGDEAFEKWTDKPLEYSKLPPDVKKAVNKEYKEVFGEEAKTLDQVLEERKLTPEEQMEELSDEEIAMVSGEGIEEAVIRREKPSEGQPMPQYIIDQKLEEAKTYLEQIQDVKLNDVNATGIDGGQAYLFIGSEGNIITAATAHLRPEIGDGKLYLDSIVSSEPGTITSKKAFELILDYHVDKNNGVFPPRIEMSPAFRGAFARWQAKKKPAKTAAEPSAPKGNTLRILGVEYRNMGTGQMARIRQELNKYKAYIIQKIHLIEGVDRPEFVSITYDGHMKLEVTHLEDIDQQIAHELGHIAYQEHGAAFNTEMIGVMFDIKMQEELFAEAAEEYITGKPTDTSRIPETIRKEPFRKTDPEMVDKALAWMGERDIFFRVEGETEEVRVVARDRTTPEEAMVMSEPAFEDSTGGEEFEGDFPMSRLPRHSDFFLDLDKIRENVRNNRAIQDALYPNKQTSKFEEAARTRWESADEEGRKALTKATRINKAARGHNWDDLGEIDRVKLVINEIPDGSLHFRMIKTLADVAEFMEFLEEMTSSPTTAAYFRASEAKMLADAIADEIEKQFVTLPGFKEVLKDSKQLALVQQELNARNEAQGVEHPDNLTDIQLEMVDEIQRIYDDYKPYVRYLAFMRTKPNTKALAARFPDAIREGKEEELAEALRLRKRADFDGLWGFLKNCDWGVVESGFDPRQIANPALRIMDYEMGYVRGSGSLERRTKVEFPEGKLRRNIVTRMIAYINQMEIQWQIEPELNNFEKLWKDIYHKFDNKDALQNELDAWWGKMQGIPSKYGWFTRQLMKLRRQAFAAVFIEPVLSIRNSFQSLLMHMDRSELIRYIKERKELPSAFVHRTHRYFEIRVSQLAGLRRDWLQVGAEGLPGFGRLNVLVDKLNVYGWSDYYPRMWSFLSYANKAYRATQQYLKDGNVKKWIKDSGAIHMRHTEVNYVLSKYLADPNAKFETFVDGIEKMSGAEAAIWFVAGRNTDRTHFRYRREQRSTIEQGAAGDLLYSLFVFPRGYGQRVAWQADKMIGLFKGDTSWSEARGGFNDLLKLFIVAQVFSSFWRGLTGRERNPYDPFSILTQWTFGGLAIGVVTDTTEFLSDLAVASNPVNDKETRNSAISRLPQEFKRILETQVPFYKRAIDVWASVVDTKDPDMYWMRQLVSKFYEDYTPEELEKLDMEMWEHWRKAILGADPEDPSILDKLQVGLQENRDMLGTVQPDGKFYTLRDYGNRIASLTKDMPDFFVSDYVGSHPLDIFYKDCEAQWKEYYSLPTTPSSVRRQWREAHPEEEAMMLFWGKFSESVYPIGSGQWEDIAQLLFFWFSLYKIDQTMHPAFANWGLDLTR